MHLLMESKNTASFLNRFLRPGTNSLLSKHLVSIQATAIHWFLFLGMLPVPKDFLSSYHLAPPRHQAGPHDLGRKILSTLIFPGHHPVLMAPLLLL
jgi:hypothetical protein